ncbi:hypothetical protein P9J64_00070 [Deltaproteobacteria bacterium IMCC39524]|nr:hypothetical protein [Deltaproteobacteria bacterium IMCC39524]
MFEIIMLFAFLLAATSQLFPRKHANNRVTARKTAQGKKKRREPLHRSAKRSELNRGNAKRRTRDYVFAA